MNRREFIKYSLASVGALALPATADKFIESTDKDLDFTIDKEILTTVDFTDLTDTPLNYIGHTGKV